MKLDRVIAVRADKTIYRDGDVIIKVFAADKKKSDVLNEALNQARVEESGLNIPAITDVKCLDDGRWSISMQHVPGKTLAQLIEEHPEKIDEYLNRFVDIQLDIHAHKVPLLNKLKDKMNRKISAADLDATTRYELHTRLDSMPKHKNLCHGDFNPTNIIITKEGTPYIIDWSHATQGNASADVARSYLLFYLAGEEKLAQKYLKLYCQKSDTAIQYVQRWIPIVAASRLTKANENEVEFLRNWIDVVDYE